MLSLSTDVKVVGILSESFPVPCRPACVSPVGGQSAQDLLLPKRAL